MKTNKKSITFELPVDLVKAFNQEIEKNAQNKSALLRRFILEYVRSADKPKEMLPEGVIR